MVDVYSFGIFMWELASRMIPYVDDERLEGVPLLDIVGQIVNEELRPLLSTSLKQHMSEQAVCIMKRCWHAQAEERPDMTEVVEELQSQRRP